MYKVAKRIEVSAAHSLMLNYESKCAYFHGHNWIIWVYMKSEELNEDGMVYDFSHIKEAVSDMMDHEYINELVDFNPTAENLAKWICDRLGHKCYRVTVQESEGNIAEYEV